MRMNPRYRFKIRMQLVHYDVKLKHKSDPSLGVFVQVEHGNEIHRFRIYGLPKEILYCLLQTKQAQVFTHRSMSTIYLV